MPDSSSGNYSLPPGYLAVTGQVISASQHNPSLEDLGAAMTRRLMRDGRAPMLGNLQMNGYRVTGAEQAVDAGDYVTLAQMQAAVAAVATVPTGMMVPYSGMTTPTGWLVVNGQEVSRTTHAALYAHALASGNMAATQGAKTHGQFGPGNGTTTFTLPNLYADDGYFIRPMASGRTIGSVQADELKSHQHTGSTSASGDHVHGGVLRLGNGGSGDAGASLYRGSVGTTDSAGAHTHGVTINATGGTETRPKNIAYPVIMKA